MDTTVPPARSVLITGGNTGLGGQAALTLAHRGWTVLMTARTVHSGEVAASRLRLAVPGTQVVPLLLDLGDLRSVDALVQQVQAGGTWPPLHAIIANAGIQHVSARKRTAQGFEATFGVNHLGHVHLIRGLLDTLHEPGQVVFVSSGTHDPATQRAMPFPAPYDARAEVLAFPDRFPLPARSDVEAGRRRYAASKLANTQTAFHLARLMQSQGRHITVNAFDPGLMPGSGSRLARGYRAPERLIWNHVLPLLTHVNPAEVSTVQRSGTHLAALLEAPYRDMTGTYFRQGGRSPSPVVGHASATARDAAKAHALWNDSLVLLDQTAVQAGQAAEHA